MNELHKAYEFFRLSAGCPFDEVKRRYKRMAMAWHPDRMPSPEAKAEAEEELKLINHYFDILKNHYEMKHKDSGPCECRESKKSTASGANQQKGTDEDAARRRADERRQQEAHERAKQQHEQESAKAQAAQQEMQDAVNRQSTAKTERFRWQITACAAMVLIGLLLFAWVGLSIKGGIQTISNEIGRLNGATQTQPIPPNTFTAYVPPYERIPGASALDAQNVLKAQAEEERRKKHEQDLYFAKLDVDQHQKTIQQCNYNIAQLGVQIANPLVSEAEKARLKELESFQEHCRSQAEQDLNVAQERVRSL